MGSLSLDTIRDMSVLTNYGVLRSKLVALNTMEKVSEYTSLDKEAFKKCVKEQNIIYLPDDVEQVKHINIEVFKKPPKREDIDEFYVQALSLLESSDEDKYNNITYITRDWFDSKYDHVCDELNLIEEEKGDLINYTMNQSMNLN